MVSVEELKKMIKEKTLLIGESATGKTFIASEVAIALAGLGKDIIYIDTEYGCQKEFLRLSTTGDKVLDKVDLRVKVRFDELFDSILEEGNCFLKIVDGLDELIRMNKEYLEDKFSQAGFYVMGEKTFDVKDKETFVLPWNFYPKVYGNAIDSIYKMLKHDYHILVTMKSLGETDAKKHVEDVIKAKFDTVIETKKVLRSMEGSGGVIQTPLWYGTIIKNRGRENETSNVVTKNIHKALIDRFKELVDERK
uniref:Putative ATPase domain containing protein n=1 Tax=viral metagenome TaxID=1070528 RepID=A0A6M3XLL3_9ZZZZ